MNKVILLSIWDLPLKLDLIFLKIFDLNNRNKFLNLENIQIGLSMRYPCYQPFLWMLKTSNWCDRTARRRVCNSAVY